ncbi:hypothetical protein AT574_14180 [Phaeobacter inhibens]|nr:hypothetical protein AT574_14180 [Phaeobacter inhibens]
MINPTIPIATRAIGVKIQDDKAIVRTNPWCLFFEAIIIHIKGNLRCNRCLYTIAIKIND